MEILSNLICHLPSTESDSEYLYHLTEEAARKYIEGNSGQWNEAEVRNYIADAVGSALFSIAFRDDIRVGAMCIEDRFSHIQLEQIYIEPKFQLQGIGTILLNDLIKRASSESKPIRLRVLKPNSARKFYEKLGFRIVEENDERYFLQYDA